MKTLYTMLAIASLGGSLGLATIGTTTTQTVNAVEPNWCFEASDNNGIVVCFESKKECQNGTEGFTIVEECHKEEEGKKNSAFCFDYFDVASDKERHECSGTKESCEDERERVESEGNQVLNECEKEKVEKSK
jgi:hypothetical protein